MGLMILSIKRYGKEWRFNFVVCFIVASVALVDYFAINTNGMDMEVDSLHLGMINTMFAGLFRYERIALLGFVEVAFLRSNI
ncbi:hypothetical protein QVD17_19599 [Tagetes erecta]|uniref:Uncharacterized protein n=1 Tax=Tagetes erecta TaxID=13708 RepID=A0AAD8KJP1_TARER|nr:hypothetical protein QVD17_19599 [Tagetes erecta]